MNPYTTSMNTTQTPSNPDLHLVLDHYFDPNQTLHQVATRFGFTLFALAAFLAEPPARKAIALIRAMFRRRSPHLLEAALQRDLELLNAILVLPDNPSPADQDRLRKNAETSRRVADLLRKIHTPPPLPKTQRATKPAAPLALANAPTTAALLNASSTSHLELVNDDELEDLEDDREDDLQDDLDDELEDELEDDRNDLEDDLADQPEDDLADDQHPDADPNHALLAEFAHAIKLLAQQAPEGYFSHSPDSLSSRLLNQAG
jgi:hypothetical protein